MQRIARLVMELLAALTIMLALGCATALARPTHGALFRYLVGDLPSGARVSVSFTSQAQGRSGQASVISGSMSTMEFNANGMQVVSAGPDPLSATVHQQLLVAGQTLTGTATVPAGTLLQMTNELAGHRIYLKSGPFSIPTGVSVPKKEKINCVGTSTSCEANVPVPAGTSSRRLVIKLSHPKLHLESVAAFPGATYGTQQLGRGQLVNNGADYVITLHGVTGNPRDSRLVFKFGTAEVKPRRLGPEKRP
jgi:hypothetical protein